MKKWILAFIVLILCSCAANQRLEIQPVQIREECHDILIAKYRDKTSRQLTQVLSKIFGQDEAIMKPLHEFTQGGISVILDTVVKNTKPSLSEGAWTLSEIGERIYREIKENLACVKDHALFQKKDLVCVGLLSLIEDEFEKTHLELKNDCEQIEQKARQKLNSREPSILEMSFRHQLHKIQPFHGGYSRIGK